MALSYAQKNSALSLTALRFLFAFANSRKIQTHNQIMGDAP